MQNLYFYVIIGLIVLIVLYVIAAYNSLVKLRNQVKEAFATMDVYLKKRWDLIPNLVETVKGYTKHEKGTLEEIVKLRGGTYGDMDIDGKIENGEQISRALGKIFALAEAYPDLKANQNFLDLSGQLSQIENDIANSRKYYNAVVKIFNNKVEVIPSNIVASMFGFKTMKMFETAEGERENVKVDFS